MSFINFPYFKYNINFMSDGGVEVSDVIRTKYVVPVASSKSTWRNFIYYIAS